MGSLAIAVGKSDYNTFNAITSMLGEQSGRGCDAFGVASSREAIVKCSLEKLKKEEINSNHLIGHSLTKYARRDSVQPIQIRDFSLVVEGRFYPSPPEGEPKHLIENVENLGSRADDLIRKFNGAYTFAFAKDDGVVLGRDTLGANPLYFGENKDFCAASSERKALWEIGIEKTSSFPPGNTAYVNHRGFSFKTVKTLTQPPIRNTEIKAAAKELQNTLFQSVKQQTSDLEEVAIAFSGGVDSSLVASLAKSCGVKVQLIFVGLEGSSEIDLAQHAARALNLPLHNVAFSLDDLEHILPKVQWLIEDSNILDTCIATPLYWVAQQAAKMGFHILLSGQGADELFGGYHRYLEEYAKHGSIGLQRRLLHDIVANSESGFPRDNKVAAYHKVELRNPLISWSVVQLALSFPVELKIASPKDPLRKKVLRESAKIVGIPVFIAERPKKAIQYTTGVIRGIRKLARKEGLTMEKYVKMISAQKLDWDQNEKDSFSIHTKVL
ncbi:MAG: asparagine synthetase B [Candidatus Bathyarchaeota archaeon]|nr:asparagine synthetase B [Candidatus Bathyarchaeota archaeon]